MTTIKAHIGKTPYLTHIETSTNQIVADEPVDLGGHDEGFAPYELLASSLAACTCITLRMYADRKAWDLSELEVVISVETAKEHTVLHRQLAFTGNLDAEQKQRLLQIANLCPVHKILTRPIQIETEMRKVA